MKCIAAMAAACLLVVNAQALAQEIRCDQVFMNPSETRICGSENLLRLDQEMAQAYRRAEPHMPDIKKLQRTFRKALKSCKGDDACLTRSYEARNAELRTFINTLPVATAEEAEALGQAADEASIERGDVPVVQESVASAPAEAESEPSVEEPVQEVVDPALEPQAATEMAPKPQGFTWWVYVVAAVVAFGLWTAFWDWLKDAVKRCPNCHRWFAGIEVDRDRRASTEYRTVDRVKVRKNARHETTGSDHYKEQEALNVVRTKHHMVCKICKNQWIISTIRTSS